MSAPRRWRGAHTGAGVRKPPMEETAGEVARWRVRCYGDFVAGGSLSACVDHCLGTVEGVVNLVGRLR